MKDRDKLKNNQGHPATVFIVRAHRNGIAVGLVGKQTKTCIIGPLLGRSQCKLTLWAKELSLAGATHRTARVIWLCKCAGFMAKPRVGVRVSVVFREIDQIELFTFFGVYSFYQGLQ